MLELNNYFKETEKFKLENIKLKRDLAKVNKKSSKSGKLQLNKNVEIQDVSEKPNENLVNLIKNIGNFQLYTEEYIFLC